MTKRRRGNYGRGPLQSRAAQEVVSSRATAAGHPGIDLSEVGGLDALIPRPTGLAPATSTHPPAKRDAVVELRKAHPEYGTRRIRDMLARFEAWAWARTQVRAILHEQVSSRSKRR